MLLGLASLILAILFAFKAYDSSKNGTIAPEASNNIRMVGILVAVCLVLGLVSFILAYIQAGSKILTNTDLIYKNGIVMILFVVIMILIAVSAFYAWIAYQQSLNTAINTDILITAIALTVPIVSYLFNMIQNFFRDRKELSELRERVGNKTMSSNGSSISSLAPSSLSSSSSQGF
jgi:hypothetical protein